VVGKTTHFHSKRLLPGKQSEDIPTLIQPVSVKIPHPWSNNLLYMPPSKHFSHIFSQNHHKIYQTIYLLCGQASIGVAGGAKGDIPPKKILENTVILCFEMCFSEQNSTVRLKSSILAPQKNFLAPTKVLGWLRHCKQARCLLRTLRTTYSLSFG